MNKLVRRFIPSLEDHLSDDRLASLFCGELPPLERWIARWHLETCWQCGLRQEELEGRRSDRVFDHCRDVLAVTALPKEPEAEFARKLRLRIQNATPQKTKALRLPKISLPELSPMNPALVVCIVLSFATILSFYFWWQQRAPRIGENALLVRAEKWDRPANEGVVYQSVRITLTKQTKKETIARSIYRDVQGKRQPKQVTLNHAEEQVRTTLTEAGLDWDEPLSASGYQSWHDRQHIREDHIARAGSHLLRLTTTVPEGVVAEQSLTVRDTDFHPVQRTVELRDSGTVEIAELDFKVLPWNAVSADAFEPLASPLTALASSPARVLSFPRLPEVLTSGQIDEAELGARLMLNQLHADTGEQLEIHREQDGVTVQGIVETEERKRELKLRLRMVPHVTPAIQSEEEAKANPSSTEVIQSIATASMPDQPSPLQEYLRTKGQSVGEIANLGERLFQNALAISQESKDIADLQSRFGSEEQRTLLATATLTELIYSHHERLNAALQRERELLAEVAGTSAKSRPPDATQTASLVAAANRNLALAKELIQTNHPAARPAERILADMSAAVSDLVTEAHEAYGKSQGDAALSRKK